VSVKPVPVAGCALAHWDFWAGAFQCALCGPHLQLGGGASPGRGPCPGCGPSPPAPGTGPAPWLTAGAQAASCTKRRRMFSKSLGWKSCLKTFSFGESRIIIA